jgi:hypothetical protein
MMHGLSSSDETFCAIARSTLSDRQLNNRVLTTSVLEEAFDRARQSHHTSGDKSSQHLLGLILACQQAESHGGRIVVQGSPESGYRYVLMLPKITSQDNSSEPTEV